jgi:hypothetical protein
MVYIGHSFTHLMVCHSLAYMMMAVVVHSWRRGTAGDSFMSVGNLYWRWTKQFPSPDDITAGIHIPRPHSFVIIVLYSFMRISIIGWPGLPKATEGQVVGAFMFDILSTYFILCMAHPSFPSPSILIDQLFG